MNHAPTVAKVFFASTCQIPLYCTSSLGDIENRDDANVIPVKKT